MYLSDKTIFSETPPSGSWGHLKPMAMLIAVALFVFFFLILNVGENFLFIQIYTRYTVSSKLDGAFPCKGFCIKGNFALSFFADGVLYG